MANSLGTLSGALVIMRALQLTFTKRPLLRMISMGFKELDGRVENMLLNQTANTRLRQVAVVNAFGTGPTDQTDTDVPITLSAMKEVHVAFTPAQYNATDRNLIEESAEPIAAAIANHIVDSISALWLNASYANKLIVASAWTYANTVLQLRSKANLAAIPRDNRFFVYGTGVETALLDDPLIVSALNNPANGEAIRTGKLPEVAGFGMDDYPSIPANGENLVGMCGTPDHAGYAARAPKDPSEVLGGAAFPGVIGYVEDPNSGFRVMVNQWVDPSTLIVNNRLVWLEGYAVGNAANAVRLVTA